MFVNTKEQNNIEQFIEVDSRNLLIEALAGCGKTTSLINLIKLLPQDKSITFLAFNKHIQMELKTKLPENVWCYTSHGLGRSGIARKYKDAELDEFKMDKIISAKLIKWDLSDFQYEEELEQYIKSIKRLTSLCKSTLTTQKKKIPELAEKYDIPIFEDKDVNRILSILETSINDKKTYDFDDMIFLPAVDPKIWLFPQDYVLVDECFPHNQYISTEIGKKKIGHLANMYSNGIKLPMITTYNEKDKFFEKKKIIRVWCNGEKNIYEVRMGGKRRIKATKNHKLLTLDGWKRLDKLKIGDAILSNYNTQPYLSIPNNIQRDLIFGTSLGDSSVDKLKAPNIFRIKCIHGKPQKEYVDWKAKILNSETYLVPNNGYSKKPAYRFNTTGFYFKENLRNKKQIIDKLTPKSLAVLFMDDGSKSKLRDDMRLYGLSYDELLNKHLSETILNKFNIISSVRVSKSSSTKKKYWYLCFNTENSEKLSKLIAPYIYPSMSFKISEKHRHLIDIKNWSCENNPYGCMVVDKEYKFIKKEMVYDMEVEDNHNFIITSISHGKGIAKDYGFIAHNCQDMNRAQQAIIQKILKKDKNGNVIGRLISVGDENQSIYGFSGSDINSFNWFKNFPNTVKLPLTTTFRCSKEVVLEANKIVPDLKAMKTAKRGSVRNGDALKEAQSGDFILCRKTLPLVKLFFLFLSEHRKAIIKGSDIGNSLIEMVKRKRNIDVLKSNLKSELRDLGNKLRAKGVLDVKEHSGYVALEDKVMVLLFIAEMSKDMYELKRKIQEIFTNKIEGIVLSTIHKIKGLEADRVFIIRPDILPMKVKKAWEYQQEKNLEYVAITRAKNELIYDYDWNDEDVSLSDIRKNLRL